MKKILLILSFLIPFLVNAQIRVERTGPGVFVWDARLQAPINLVIPVYPDTATANANIGLDSLGALIKVRGIPVKVYFRDSTTGHHMWREFATNTGTGVWGSITGTITSQTDLMTQLAARQPLISLGTTAQYFRGDLSLATFPTNLSAFTNGPGYVTSLNSTNSITGDGTVTTPFKLSGDAASPGATQYYGTDAGATKGFHSLSALIGLDPVLAIGDTGYKKQMVITWDPATTPAVNQHSFFDVNPDSTSGYFSVGDDNGNRTNFFLIMSQRSVGFEADSGLLIKAGGNTKFTQLMTQAAQPTTTVFRLRLPVTGNLNDTIATKFDVRAGVTVASVSNSDGTLTISPTTGAVIASLNLAHSNTWTVTQNFFDDAIGINPNDGIRISNTTAATSGVQIQYSPSLVFRGQAWKTNATAVSQTAIFQEYVEPVAGAAVITANYHLQAGVAGATPADILKIDNSGNMTVVSSLGIGSVSSSTAILSLAGTTAKSSFRIPTGVAPTSPVQGDFWATSGHLLYRDGSTSFDLLTPTASGINDVLARLQTFTGDQKIGGGQHKFTIDSVSSLTLNTYGVTLSTFDEGIIMENKTAVSSGSKYQFSPALHFIAHAFNSSDRLVEWREYSKAEAAGMSYKGDLVWENQLQGGGWNERLRLLSNGQMSVPGGATFANSVTITTGSLVSPTTIVSTQMILGAFEVTTDAISSPVTVVTSGTITETLPGIATDGVVYEISNIGTGTVTVTAPSGTITNGLTSSSTWALTQGKFLRVVTFTSGPIYAVLASN